LQDDLISGLMSELHNLIDRLVQDQYGNYVVQHILQHSSPANAKRVVDRIKGQVLFMSQHKFASNVVEKCVAHCSETDRTALVEEVCKQVGQCTIFFYFLYSF
jgi:pumilio RNA-binding family